MSLPGTFERVYAAIKERLTSGVYRPGQRLEPAVLADELNASVTPIRDALHRLTGERLVEAPRHEGFRVPILTETTLRHLYAWHHDLLLLAILSRKLPQNRPELPPETSERGTALHKRCNAAFLALARSTGSPEHLIALATLTERIEPVQRLEDALLDAAEEESAGIVAAIVSGDRKLLRKALLHYHRRRERIVPEVISRLLER
ncbi:MAG TPA: GntR family transcriptional regulator [Sphingomicrobium sp.]|nr:GntR family transcriptional regulator [Sphingomicrobium sp.]